MRFSEIADLIRSLPLAMPGSSSIVEGRFRKRLALAIEAAGLEVDRTKQRLLKSGMFIEGLKPDATSLSESELELLAEAVAAHATPILHPTERHVEPLSRHSVIEDALRAVVGTPRPIRAKQDHPDSLETAARLLRAEELLSEAEALIAPVLNNSEEREPVERVSERYRSVLKSLWPTRVDEVAESARTPRRAEWSANLVDIVAHHWNKSAQANGTRAPTKERIRQVSSNIASMLGVRDPPTAEGLRER